MNFLDITALVVLGLSGLLAFSRGFGKEALSLTGWILSALLTFHVFYPPALALAHQYINLPVLPEFVAAAIPFLLCLMVMALLSAWIRAFLRPYFSVAGLGPLNRSLGFAFGLLRGAIILSLLYLLLAWAVPRPEDRPVFINEARSLPLIARGAAMLQAMLPARFADLGKATLEDANQTLEKGKALNNAYQILNAPAASSPVTAPITQAPTGPSAPPSIPANQAQVPNTKANAAPANQTGYKDSERKDLERLIEGTGQ